MKRSNRFLWPFQPICVPPVILHLAIALLSVRGVEGRGLPISPAVPLLLRLEGFGMAVGGGGSCPSQSDGGFDKKRACNRATAAAVKATHSIWPNSLNCRSRSYYLLPLIFLCLSRAIKCLVAFGQCFCSGCLSLV
jgi:hypothetical protein